MKLIICFGLLLLVLTVCGIVKGSPKSKVINLNPSAPTPTRYEPTWESIDKRPTPPWFDEAKIGIFLHWGVFSVPSFVNAWFWLGWKGPNPWPAIIEYMKANYPPNFTYADFAREFTADLYNPDDWAELFEAAGAKYVVLTSKHHEGFCNWNTSYSFNWNSLDVGPNKDLLGELAAAIRRRKTLRFGLYHSLFEWFNPLFIEDQNNGFKTQNYVWAKPIPALKELIVKYKPEVLWSDGDWMASYNYWNSTDFLAWLFNESPVKDTIAVNDRWGSDARCVHGGFFNCDDRYNPGVLQKHKWENAMTLDKLAWTYRRTAKSQDFLTMEELLAETMSTISCGGNILINTGPRKDGTIDPLMEERLRQLGSWLKINGEAVYGSSPWLFQNDTVAKGVWYTWQPSTKSVYATVLNWPDTDSVFLAAPTATSATVITMLGFPGNLKYEPKATGGLTVHLPLRAYGSLKWTWVLKLTNLGNKRSEDMLYKEPELESKQIDRDMH